MANRIDAVMKAVKAPGLQAPLDFPCRHPQRPELPPSHHPMLPPSQLAYPPIRRPVSARPSQ
jgi:hypothetical protein